MASQNRNDIRKLHELVRSKLLGLENGRAEEITSSPALWVFGSNAAGVSMPSSDLDLLIVSNKNFHWREGDLDVVGITPATLVDTRWLTGELATHIAAYGIQLKGEPGLIANSVPSKNAAVAKKKRLRAYLKALDSRWRDFDFLLKMKYAKKIRQDLIRLGLLKKLIAVPPTILLGTKARVSGVDVVRELAQISDSLSPPFIADLVRRISRHKDVAVLGLTKSPVMN